MHLPTVRALVVASPRRFTVVRLREHVLDTFWIIPGDLPHRVRGARLRRQALDRSLAVDAGSAPWWVGTPEDASAVLQVIAASTLTFLAGVFSITLVACSWPASSSPRG